MNSRVVYPHFKNNKVQLNKYISLRLEESKIQSELGIIIPPESQINIYLNNQLFRQCKYLAFHLSLDKLNDLSEIRSIDDLEQEDHSNQYNQIDITPQEEFWGHCSNLQAWIENDYDTRLLHRNLAFPLLKELTNLGDLKAIKIFKKEIIERFSSHSIPVMFYLLVSGFLNDFSDEERQLINEGLDKIFTTSFFAKVSYSENYNILFDKHELDNNLEKYQIGAKLLARQYTRKDLNITLPPYIEKTPGDTITDITTIPELKTSTDYTALGLFQNKITEIKGLGGLTYLRQLGLNRNEITEIKNLDHLQHLRYLSLPGNHISEIKGLENLTDLEFLSLGSNKISKIEGLERLKKLKVLSLWRNRIKDIEGLENLKDLRQLGLGGNKISEIHGLDNLKNLRVLILSSNKISEIKGIENLTHLKEVTFHSNNISKIRDFPNLPELREVNLCMNPISSKEIEVVKKILGSNVNVYYSYPRRFNE